MNVKRLPHRDWRRYRRIRLISLTDAPDAFGSTFARESIFDDFQWRRRLSNGSVTFVAILDGEDVGIATGVARSGRVHAAGLVGMWVAPDARRIGAGSALVRAVIDWARFAGFERIDLDVTDKNRPAIALYERFGFLPTERTGNLPAPRDHIAEHERSLRLRGA